jgi:hypothetical protein
MKCVLFCLLLFGGLSLPCVSNPKVLTASVKGQQYGTIEIYRIEFSSDSLFSSVISFYAGSPDKGYDGGVDLAFRASLSGSRAAHMGCTQENGIYPAAKAEIRFDASRLKSGATYFLRIIYSKNSDRSDKLILAVDGTKIFEFTPSDHDSWENFKPSKTYKVTIPGKN